MEFRSYHHLWNKRKRPSFLNLEVSLNSAGELKDTPAGRRNDAEYLSWPTEWLGRGNGYAVSRLVSELFLEKRREAKQSYERIVAKVKD